MDIDPAEVERIARLARLSLSPKEIERYRGDLERILEYVARVQSQTADVDPAGAGADCADAARRTPLREDRVEAGLTREQALQNAPDTDGEFFRVPPVLPQEEDS